MPSLFRRFLHEDQGAVLVEHAVLISIVVGLAFAGLLTLGDACRESFQGAASAMDAGRNSSASKDPGAISASSFSAQASNDPQRSPAQWPHAEFLLGLAAAAGLGAAWFLWCRCRKATPEAVLRGTVVAATPACVQARFVAKRQQILQALSGDVRKLLESDLDVRQLMTDQVFTILPSLPVGDLKTKMSELEVHHLLVCSADRKLLGVISDRDLKSGRDGVAGDVMTRDPLTIGPGDQIKPVVTLMLNKHISSLPVVENEKLVGILTTTDLVLALQCTMQIMQSISAELIAAHCRDPLPYADFVGTPELTAVGA